MSDEITKCDKIINSEDAVVRYDFSYRVEDAGKENSFCVTVLTSEMNDASDSTEAKLRANVKAAAIRAAWLAQEETTVEEVASVIGSVTL